MPIASSVVIAACVVAARGVRIEGDESVHLDGNGHLIIRAVSNRTTYTSARGPD
jgi:hypothetical protein